MSKWGMVRLGDVCDVVSGFAFDSQKFTDDSTAMPIIRIRDVVRGFTATYTTEKYDKKFVVKKGDLLIGMDGEFNIAEWKDEPALLNQRVCKIFAGNESIFEKYLLYFMPAALKRIEDKTPFVTVKHISIKQIKEILIPLPSIEEQKRIADILDKASNLIDLRKQQLEKMDLLIKSKFIDMFGDPVTNPKGWEVKKLVEVTNKIGSGSTPRGGKESYIEEGISLIRSMNVHDGRFKYDQLAYIDEVQAKQMDIVAVIENDVLINITGASVARSCVVPKELLPARVNQHVSIVRCICEKVNPIYLNQLFISDSYKSVLLAVGGAGGATREAITKQQLEKLDILIPPIELQNQFAEFVEQVEKQKTVMQQSLEKMETNYKALMQEYFG